MIQARHDYMFLAFFVFACLAIGGLSGWVTSTSVASWYPTITKPPFNPPAWVFGPVWTTLYVMMAVAAWRVWRKMGWGKPLYLFIAQLVLNSLWSFLFFGMQSPGLALLDIAPLLVLILLTIRAFWPIDRIAGGLLMPYAAWVSFATLLNASIWWLN